MTGPAACARGKHAQCPHSISSEWGFNPRRMRLESGTELCPCDCHASCAVLTDRRPAAGMITIPRRTWLESCTCPGAKAARAAQEKIPRQRVYRRGAFQAAKAQAADKSREEIRELYLAELSARGLKAPSSEALDADVAAIAGDPLPRFRLAGQAATDIVKLVRNARHYP